MPKEILHKGEVYLRDPYWKDYEQIERADIDGDGVDETIVRFCGSIDGKNTFTVAFTAIYDEEDGKRVLVKTIAGGEKPKDMELFDVDDDGIKDLMLYDHSGNHYTLIIIYSFKDGNYKCLFKNGTACYVHKVNTEQKPVRITIGRENWEKEGFCYAVSDKESLLEVWEWDGGKFAYSPKLSTTPIITEKEAIERAWQVIKKTMEKTKAKETSEENQGDESRYDESDTEFAVKCWQAGSRAMELFKEEREEAIKRRNE
ncbi:hypothetical protein ACFL5X_01130 [Candidatus Omnitrophota bacterium]